MIKPATFSVIDYDASLTGSLGEETKRLFTVLEPCDHARQADPERPAAKRNLRISMDWIKRYQELMARLIVELEHLQMKVRGGS